MRLKCNCGLEISVPEGYEQDSIRCIRCGSEIPIPSATRAPPPPSASSAVPPVIPLAPLQYHRTGTGWESFRCACGSTVQLSPAFDAPQIRCNKCGRTILQLYRQPPTQLTPFLWLGYDFGVTHVATPPTKPVLIFDGDCNFCRRWISRWQQGTGDRVEYVPFQDSTVASRFPELTREQCAQAVQFIDTDGHIYSAAEAVFRALAVVPCKRWPLWLLSTNTRRRSYHRGTLPLRRQTPHRVFFPDPPPLGTTRRATHALSDALALSPTARESFTSSLSFLSGYKSTALSAATASRPQHNSWNASITGRARTACGTPSLLPRRFAGSTPATAFCIFFAAAERSYHVLVILGIATAPSLALLWLFYLSLCVVGEPFMGFQWDALLLETGLLAIFFAPRQLLPGLIRETPPSRTRTLVACAGCSSD